MNATSIYKSPAGEKAIMTMYENILARWPVPCEKFYLDTRHGQTFVIASGAKTAPPLLLLHGSSSNALAWSGEVAEYSRQFRVYAVDLPGEPGKSAPNRTTWYRPAFAEWVADLLNALKIEKVFLLGISQGGWTALKFATTHPERVAKLVLLTPGGIAPVRLSFLVRALPASFIARVIPLPALNRWSAEVVNRIVFGRQSIHADAVKFMNVILAHFNARIEPQPMFTDEALRRLTMPTLLIGGQEDALLPTEKIEARLKTLLPNLTSILLPETGHVLHNLAAQITPFLSSTKEAMI